MRLAKSCAHHFTIEQDSTFRLRPTSQYQIINAPVKDYTSRYHEGCEEQRSGSASDVEGNPHFVLSAETRYVRERLAFRAVLLIILLHPYLGLVI